MRHLLLCALALAPLAPAIAKPKAAAAAETTYAQLLAADRAFSAAGQGKPLAEALGAIFDRDAIMVAGGTPDLVRGADAIRARLAAQSENATSNVEWSPIGGGLSADGSHGFTYGAMTVRPKAGAPRPLKYLAYWIKRPQGWRVFGYKRIGAVEGVALTPGGTIIGQGKKRSDDAAATLKASEGAFSDEAQKIGLRAAFQKWGRAESVNLGAADSIAVGAQAIGEGVGGSGPTSSVTWAADEVMVARSGDLGLSYGLLHLNQPQEGRPSTIPFFTIWARPSPRDAWRYVAE
jgi:hypothetical protein